MNGRNGCAAGSMRTRRTLSRHALAAVGQADADPRDSAPGAGMSGHRNPITRHTPPTRRGYPRGLRERMSQRVEQGGTVENMPGYSATKDDHLKRLRRIEGQVRGIARMVDEDKYCIDILTQVSAVNRALQSVALGLLDEHMGHCLVDAARAGGEEQESKLKEASDAIARLVRS